MGAWDLKEPEIPYNGDDGEELKNDEKQFTLEFLYTLTALQESTPDRVSTGQE